MRAAVLLLLMMIGMSAASSPRSTAAPGGAGLTWKIDEAPFRLTILDGSRMLLRQHNGPPGAGTRLSYKIREGSAMRTLTSLVSSTPTSTGAIYRVATTEPDRIATLRVSRTPRGLHVDLDLGTASTSVRTVYEAFESAPGEHFLGTGERQHSVDLRRKIVPIKAWAPCGSSKPTPFYASSNGYGVQFNETAAGRMAFGNVTVVESALCPLGTSPCETASGLDVVQICLKTTGLSYEIYPGSPDQVVKAYTASTGRPPLPRPDQFAIMKWRDAVSGERDLVEDADRFARARIPLHWLLIDNPWEKNGCVGTFVWDPKQFPDPQGMLKRLHTRGLEVMLWVSPTVKRGCGSGLYPPGLLSGSGALQAIDLTDPVAAAALEARLVKVLRTGIDGFKIDRGDEVDFELRPVAAGSGDELHNQIPLLLAQTVARASRTARHALVPTLFRAGFTGAQRHENGSWSGDLSGSWTGLDQAIRSGQTAGVAGYSTWGSDVGGYLSGGLDKQVFARWAQFGAVSPVFEVGGIGLNATPWKLGADAMESLRTAAILHYELFPYHYALARMASATGISILRPLALQYPADEGSWAADREVLVGPDLLAAPVTRPGTVADVYLPPGAWVDLARGATRQGPASLRRKTPLDELPLFLREGAAIPFNLRAPEIWKAGWDLNDQFRAGRGGWLVAPGREPSKASSAEYGTLRLTSLGPVSALELTRARRETQIVVLGTRSPRNVTIDGHPIPKSRSAAALRDRPQGWLVRPAPYAGIMLKLTPHAGRSRVSIRY